MKRPLLALSFSLLLVACQNAPLNSLSQNPSALQNSSAKTRLEGEKAPALTNPLEQLVPGLPPEIDQPVIPKVLAIDQPKPEQQAELRLEGTKITLSMKLPARPDFQTQALDLAAAAKITATLTDSNGNVYQPVGADGLGQVAYPVSGNLNLDFSNVFPDRLLIAELKVHDAGAVIPQTDLALAFSHLATSNPTVVMNFSTTPGGKAMKSLLGSNAVRARAINLSDLQTLSDAITGKAGTIPNLTYTTHPALAKTAQLATDLATLNPTALTAANYRFSGATVNATVSGLVATDLAELQVTDAASAIKQNASNGLNAILKVAAGTGLNFQARSFGTPGTTYSYNATPSSFTTTEGGTQAVTVTATPATPTITGLSVANGVIGSSLTITGTNFHTAIAGNVVKFGTTTATVTAATATSLTVTIPTGISGTQNVTVSVGTQTNAGTNNFEVKPVITSFSPTGTYEGSSFTIAGTGFNATPANNTVMIGSTAATVTAATTTSLTVTVPVMTIGSYATTVQVGTQTSTSSTFNVTPGVISLASSSGTLGSSLTLTGKGFDTTPANNTVKFGTTTATVTAASATSLTVTVPAAISGTQNVTVTVAGLTNPGTNNFAVTPTIGSLNTSSGAIGSSLTITGTGFDGVTMANNTVKFGTTTATVTAATATSLTVTVPAAISGTQNVKVTVGTQTNSGTNNYAVTPGVTSLSASGGAIASSLTITGTGFDGVTMANNTVKLGTTTATVTAATATSLTVTVPAAINGTQNVTVTVGTQTNSGTNNFDVTPAITSLSTSSGIIGSSLTITGTGFNGVTMANNIVKFGTTTATVTAATATSLTVTVPGGVAGTQNVTVTVGAQTNSGTNNFNVVPTLTSKSAAGGTAGTSVVLTGTGFTGATAVKFGSTDATSYTVDSNTQITATAPAGTSGSQIDITVTTPGGTTATSAASAFTYARYTLSVYAGTGTQGSTGDGGPATSATLDGSTFRLSKDALGNLYFPERDTNKIRKIDSSGNMSQVLAATATSPITVATDSSNNLYFYTQTPSRKIVKLDVSTSTLSDAIATFINVPNPITVDASGNLYHTDVGTPQKCALYKTTPAGVTTVIAGTIGTCGFSGDGGLATTAIIDTTNGDPGIALDASNNIYFVDSNNKRIRKIDAATGNISTIAGTGTFNYAGDGGPAINASFNFPSELYSDAAGNLYVRDSNNSLDRVIRKIDAGTGIITTILGQGSTLYTGGAATDLQAKFDSGITTFTMDSTGKIYLFSFNAKKIFLATPIP